VPPKNRRDYNETRALITKAVDALRSDEPGKLSTAHREQLADAVAYSLTPEYIASGRYELVEKSGTATKNLAIGCTPSYRDHMKKAAEAAGVTLTQATATALEDFINGAFTPSKPRREKYGSAKAQTNINARLDEALTAQAEQRCAELSKELDWHPKVTSTIKQWLEAQFGLTTTESKKKFNVSCTVTYRDYMKAATEAAGESMNQAVTTALMDFVEGKFVPSKPARSEVPAVSQRWTGISATQSKYLLVRAEQRCAELSERLGWRLTVANIIRQRLEDCYGTPKADPGE
jgi:predicted HicB family RNase H-like nuclease